MENETEIFEPWPEQGNECGFSPSVSPPTEISNGRPGGKMRHWRGIPYRRNVWQIYDGGGFQ